MTVQSAARASKRLGRTLGTTREWPRRLLLHHLPIALTTGVVLVLFVGPLFTKGGYPILDQHAGGVFPRPMDGAMIGRDQTSFSGSALTVATGYVATALLGLTLLVGPANLLLRRHLPVSSYLRRDLGWWTVIFSAVHVIFALETPDLSTILSYFVAEDGGLLFNSFGMGNWTGLAALVIVIGLLAISTDRAMRELKPRRWKNLQRLNYAMLVLVALHAFFYGALLRVTAPFTLVLLVTVMAVFVGQLAGILSWRRRKARAAAARRERQPTAPVV